MSEKITLQKIFDLAWEHFIVGDGMPALEHFANDCCYLTGDGKKCAVGLALPDGHEVQDSIFAFHEIVEEYPELFDDSVRMTSEADLQQFQDKLHDALVDGDTRGWLFSKPERRQKYIKVAERFGLTVPGDGNDTV